MKYIWIRHPFFLILGLSTILTCSTNALSATVLFESAAELADFNQTSVAGPLEFSAAAGTGGSGGLVHSATPEDTTAIYSPTSFDLTTGATHTISVDFKTGTVPFGGSSNAVVMLGFSANNNTGFYSAVGEGYVGGRIRHQGSVNGLQSQTKTLSGSAASAPANGSLSDVTFVSDNWYRISLSVTRDATPNQFSYSMLLADIGAAGTSVPAAVTNGALAGTFTNSDLYVDTTAFAGFRGVPTVSGSNVAFDNFTVTSVPEPACIALFGMGGLALLVSRRFQF